jgi:hypothetical protein
MTSATRRALVDIYGLLLREDWDASNGRRELSDPKSEFTRAMQEYKTRSGRSSPTWGEILDVLRDLGYERTSPPQDLAERG